MSHAGDDDFLQTLRTTFKVEAAEHLQAITSGLLELEKGAPGTDTARTVIETVFRAAHSLKGAARAVSFADIEGYCQALEDLFARWKRGDAAPTAETLDVGHATLDKISAALAGGERAAVLQQPPAAPTPPPLVRTSTSIASDTETVRIPVSSLDARLLQAEEMLAAKLVAAQRAADLGTLAGHFEEWNKAWAAAQPHARELRQAAERAPNSAHVAGGATVESAGLTNANGGARDGAHRDDGTGSAARAGNGNRNGSGNENRNGTYAARFFANARPLTPHAGNSESASALLEFLEFNYDCVRALEAKVRALRRAAEHDHLLIARLVDDLLESSKKLVMLPMSTLGTLLPKAVRDLSRDEGKETDFVLRGEDVRIDKRILDEMKDPLLHLLRNCVDHGIEKPDVRRQAGKPERATITLAVSSTDGNQVELRVSDDGAGIDLARVTAVAIQRGVITPETAARLTDEAARALVFEPDLSTSPIITEISGRGLGLAIVRERAERLGGRIAIDSRLGHGTDIRITLPLTLATFRGVLIEAEQRLFVVPTAQVERAMRFKTSDVETVEGRETLAIDGRAVALARLADVLDLPPAQRATPPPESKPALILGAGEQRLAFAVDAVLDEREVLVKPLKKPLVRVRNIAGATVLGSGAVVPILNVSDLLKSARTAGAPARALPLAPAPANAKRILVAEDSITSRMLIKGILESAGYRVKTAVDGLDAFAALRAEPFDCVVSDVEMPRMNGFDLTARIRAERALSELPVVLVTALDSREDKERGIDVGANAYLVKSSLDQTNLLETLRRLA